ncbi:MAG: HAMP domain-containing protein [Verrucomicrobiota bacterium]|nr:HAMP domain-containing protein [Verrucomicrobiota bacterium]
MTIRARLNLWYAAVMFLALTVMGVLLYVHLVTWPRDYARRHQETYRQEEPADPDVFEDVAGIVLWCGAPAALLALAGGWWLMKKSLAPVARLTLAAEKISAHHLHERLPRAGHGDELDRLTEVFNQMLARLDDSFRRAREFTLHASHELKTPLTVLCGETETALRDESLTSSERERLVSQLDELQRLARIVDGLTLLARADAGQLALKMDALRLDELVRDNFADLQILAEPQQVQVELAACDAVTLRGDRHRLRQLLLNLADNAVKYNQPRGRITMNLRRADSMAQFTIANTGAGIPPEFLPRVFDRFYRGDPAHGDHVDGCGLGLSIARWIVSAHGGTIQIESAPDQITTVTVRLPMDQMK